MKKVEVRGLSKHFGKTRAVDEISFEVNDGESVVLLGPSGCGKTTTLRLIAGFILPTKGSIYLNDLEIANGERALPPEQRGMSMVFQSYAVWPHKTVFENVAYGLKIRRMPKTDISQKVLRALKVVKLEQLAERYPSELSGGQQQRVALARAIVIEPAVLLLDEPLSNLDALLREEMRLELKELQQNLGITSIYVTHDQREAMVLADRLIVMRDGKIEQMGSPQEVYYRPNNTFIANFLGVTNFLRGKIAAVEDGVALVDFGGKMLKALPSSNIGNVQETVTISVRPNSIELYAPDQSPAAVNKLQGRIKRKVFIGESLEYAIDVQATELKVKTEANEFQNGEEVEVVFETDNAICFSGN